MGDYVYAFGSFWCSVGDGFGDGVEPDAGGLRGWRRYQQHPDPALDTKPGAYPNADAYTDPGRYAYTDKYTYGRWMAGSGGWFSDGWWH